MKRSEFIEAMEHNREVLKSLQQDFDNFFLRTLKAMKGDGDMTKRFIVETVEITDCDTDEGRIAKVITDTNELYSYDDLYELCDDLNKLAEENEQLRQSIDSMIETSAEISNRNVLLHEQLGETQFNHKQCEKKVKELEQKLDWICEQTGFDGVKFHYINKEVVQ